MMSEDRVEQFKQEMESLDVRDPSQGRDRLWLRIAVGLMVAGLIVAIAAYPMSHTTTSDLQQRDAIVMALIGLTAAVVGGALFLRYSFGNFLRFWLARLSYEQQQNADRIIADRG